MESAMRPARATETLPLWFALLGGHAAWSIQLLVSYFLLVPLACGTGATLPLHLLTVVTGLVALASGIVAWRSWVSMHGRGLDWSSMADSGGPRSFMAVAGLLLSALFVLLILFGGIANVMIDPCTYGSADRPPV